MTSFIPSTVSSWNDLDLNVRNSLNISYFESRITGNTIKSPEYNGEGSRKLSILHARLRHQCSSLNSDLFCINLQMTQNGNVVPLLRIQFIILWNGHYSKPKTVKVKCKGHNFFQIYTSLDSDFSTFTENRNNFQCSQDVCAKSSDKLTCLKPREISIIVNPL